MDSIKYGYTVWIVDPVLDPVVDPVVVTEYASHIRKLTDYERLAASPVIKTTCWTVARKRAYINLPPEEDVR
jgi:hypothetical protein